MLCKSWIFNVSLNIEYQAIRLFHITCEIVPDPDLLVFMVPPVFMVSAKVFLSCPTQRHDSCLNFCQYFSLKNHWQPVQGLHRLLHNACWESAEMA